MLAEPNDPIVNHAEGNLHVASSLFPAQSIRKKKKGVCVQPHTVRHSKYPPFPVSHSPRHIHTPKELPTPFYSSTHSHRSSPSSVLLLRAPPPPDSPFHTRRTRKEALFVCLSPSNCQEGTEWIPKRRDHAHSKFQK